MSRSSPRRVLVVNTAFLGDVALTAPLFALLSENGFAVEALVTPRGAELLAGHPHLERVIAYDKHKEPGLLKLLALGRKLRGRYDAVLVPHRSARSALLARLTGAGLRVGYDPPKKPYPPPFNNTKLRPRFTSLRFLYTHRVEYALGRREELRIGDLAQPLGLAVEHMPTGTLAVTEADVQSIEGRLVNLSHPCAVIFPGSAWESKRYPAEAYAVVGRRLTEAGAGVVICGSADEKDLCAKVSSNIPGSVSMTDLSLGELKALVKGAELMVTNDSVPLHLAALLGPPVVAIYGPTSPLFGFRPPERHRQRLLFHGGLDCQPCRLSPPKACPLQHHRCMKELDPERVVAACLELLFHYSQDGSSEPRQESRN